MENKYQQIAVHIRNEIIALALDNSKLPGIRELSRHFNVTAITLRKALKILEDDGLIVIRATGTYLTNKAKKEKRFLNFGLLNYDIFSLSTPYINRICRGFNSYLEEHDAGYLPHLSLPTTERYRQAGFRRICDMVEKGLINALAVTIPLKKEELAQLSDLGVPLVYINRFTPDHPYVMEDAQEGAAMLVQAFLRAGGSNPVILAPMEVKDNVLLGTDVVHLLREHLCKNGIPADDQYLFRLETEELLPGAGKTYLKEIMTQHPEIDCIIALGDTLIRESSHFLQAEKINIPLVAYSDEEPVDGAYVIAPPLRQIGRSAAEMLVKQIHSDKNSSTGIKLKPYQL